MKLLAFGLPKLHLRMHQMHTCKSQQASPALPKGQTAQGAVANVDQFVPGRSVEVVMQADDVDKLKNRRET